MNKVVAIKADGPASGAPANRCATLSVEAQAVSRLNHPECYRGARLWLTPDEQPYMVMDFSVDEACKIFWMSARN